MPESQSPYIVDWAITDKCNLSCRHCRGMSHAEISTSRARKLIDEIAELKPDWVIIEGGEPLLRQDLFELLGMMRQRQLEVHLITNGMLLNPDILSSLKNLGIRVMVSIDSAAPETYEAIRQGAEFERVVESIRIYVREGLLEAINFTILKKNYAEIPGIFELAASIGVGKITFIGLKPCHNYAEELLTPEECGQAIRLTCQAAQETGIEFFFDEPFFWVTVKEWGLPAQLPEVGAGIVVSSTSACAFGEYIFIEVNGDVKPCSYTSIVVDNVNNTSLDEIWREMLASPLICQIKDPRSRTGYCRSCQHLEECKGCRSRTFGLTGNWFASDPACPLKSEISCQGSVP
ncbi:radical SAM/SPASM domain-containing protein [Chloroflexota bacterium]